MSSLLSSIVPIIQTVFSRWTALQLAVAHSMGGPDTQAKYEAFISAFAEYLTRNIRSSTNENDIQEYLDEVLDEEFNTVLDDGSSCELARLFVRYADLILQGKLADIQQELQVQHHSVVSPIQMSVRNNEDSSSSESDEDDTIEEENEAEKPPVQSMDVDEDGWTTVHRRHSGKK